MYNLNADELDELEELEDLYGPGCVTPDMLTEYWRAKWRNRENEIKEKYAEVNKFAKSFARKNKLCALAGTGTPAQVRWAQSIRMERFESKVFTESQKNIMAKIGDAIWWIDTREYTTAQFGCALQSDKVSNIVHSTEKKKATDKVNRSAKSKQKKAEAAYAATQAARIRFIVSLKDQFELTEKTQALGGKLGELTIEDGEYRVFLELKSNDTVRILLNKKHYLVKLTSEQIEKFKSF